MAMFEDRERDSREAPAFELIPETGDDWMDGDTGVLTREVGDGWTDAGDDPFGLAGALGLLADGRRRADNDDEVYDDDFDDDLDDDDDDLDEDFDDDFDGDDDVDDDFDDDDEEDDL
jgi:hypothetical protein